MKWFKHYSDAYSNLKLQNVLIEQGLEGYGLYWLILEIVAQQSDKTFTIDESKNWKSALLFYSRIAPEKLDLILENMVKNKLIVIKNNTLCVPKMAEYADEYTKKRQMPSRQRPESVGTMSAQDKNRKDKNIVQNKSASKKPDESWTKEQSDDYIKKLRDPKNQAHVRLMGYWFDRRGFVFPSKQEAEEAFKREVSYASKLVKYPHAQIIKTMDYEESKKDPGYIYKLSTVYKNINHVSHE